METFSFIILISILLYAYGLISNLLQSRWFSGPMVFCLLGILIQFILGSGKFEMEAESVGILAEIALITILFTDATSVSLKDFFRFYKIPSRLLFIGLPLTIAFGFILSIPIFPSIGLWALLLMALILTPTDAALGQAFISNQNVPFDFREAINVESGLNDGIVLPFILLALGFLGGKGEEVNLGFFLTFFSKQLILGPIIGGIVGWVGGRLVEYASNKKWMNPVFQSISSLSLAVLAYGSAEFVGGNGFIAAFFAGLFLGTNTPIVRKRIQEFGEANGKPLSLVLFFLFGLLFVPMTLPFWNTQTLVYSLLSLTLIRMVPVFLSLKGLNLKVAQKLFLGWSGPRGIASILYLIIASNAIGIDGFETIFTVIVQTILLSIFLHGVSSQPYANWFGKKYPDIVE